MRILRIVSAGYEQGGAENGIVLTNEILRKRGHEVIVLSSDVEKDKPHFSDLEFRGVYPSGIKKLITAAFNFDAYKVTSKLVSSFKPDVVLVHTMSQPTASVLFALKKTPTALFVHGPEIFTRSLLPWYLPASAYKHGTYNTKDLTLIGRLHYIYFKYVCGLFYRIGLKNVDQIVALSSYTKGFLKKENMNATYIPNGVKILHIAPHNFDEKILLYAGRLEKFKGVDDLIKSMPDVLSKEPTAKLLIAGDGSYAQDLVEIVASLKLQKSVRFLGQLNAKKLANAYATCSIFVMPSTWPETFGKVGVEAMSVGRPVIATDVGGVKDWLHDKINGLLVSPHAPDQLSSAILSLLQNKKFAKQASTAARKTAEGFSMEQFALRIENLASDLRKGLE